LPLPPQQDKFAWRVHGTRMVATVHTATGTRFPFPSAGTCLEGMIPLAQGACWNLCHGKQEVNTREWRKTKRARRGSQKKQRDFPASQNTNGLKKSRHWVHTQHIARFPSSRTTRDGYNTTNGCIHHMIHVAWGNTWSIVLSPNNTNDDRHGVQRPLPCPRV
jgi:hypothetical protein